MWLRGFLERLAAIILKEVLPAVTPLLLTLISIEMITGNMLLQDLQIHSPLPKWVMP